MLLCVYIDVLLFPYSFLMMIVKSKSEIFRRNTKDQASQVKMGRYRMQIVQDNSNKWYPRETNSEEEDHQKNGALIQVRSPVAPGIVEIQTGIEKAGENFCQRTTGVTKKEQRANSGILRKNIVKTPNQGHNNKKIKYSQSEFKIRIELIGQM